MLHSSLFGLFFSLAREDVQCTIVRGGGGGVERKKAVYERNLLGKIWWDVRIPSILSVQK